jgi:hypothetical protein
MGSFNSGGGSAIAESFMVSGGNLFRDGVERLLIALLNIQVANTKGL